MFLLAVLALTIGSMGFFYTTAVTVKLLPFDNKSELAVVLDMPRGTSVEDTDRTLADLAAILAPIPEITSIQSHAGHGGAVQLQRPGAALLPAVRAADGRSAGQPVAQGRPDARKPCHRAGHAGADCARCPCPQGAAGQGGRTAARPAGDVHPAGRDLRPRCRNPPRRGAQGARGLRDGALHRRCRRQLWHSRRSACA